jgi:serine/threonine-protein kinase
MERLFQSDVIQVPGSFSPDGSVLALIERYPETYCDIILMDMKTRRQTPFLKSKANEAWPEISPDGRWMAYASNESGRTEVWVRPISGLGGRWQISKEGGAEPLWSKDGRKLFYRNGDQVWTADVRADGGFSAGVPRLLFEMRGLYSSSPMRSWDLWPDGRGFLMVKLEESQPQTVTEMILVQNWFEDLKRLAPPGEK